MQVFRAAALIAAMVAGSVASGRADDVTLSSLDGAIEITGRLLSYDGEVYRIDSVYGVLAMASAAVTCAGDACPDPDAFVAELLISGERGPVADLVPRLLEAFARDRGLDAVRQDEDPAHFLYVLGDPEAEREVARIRFRATSSAEGFADLVAEQADLAVTVREPDTVERARAAEAGIGELTSTQQSRVIALDAVVAAVAPDSPVEALAPVQIAGILSGRIADWSGIGGPAVPIDVHLPGWSPGLLREAITPTAVRPPTVRWPAW